MVWGDEVVSSNGSIDSSSSSMNRQGAVYFQERRRHTRLTSVDTAGTQHVYTYIRSMPAHEHTAKYASTFTQPCSSHCVLPAAPPHLVVVHIQVDGWVPPSTLQVPLLPVRVLQLEAQGAPAQHPAHPEPLLLPPGQRLQQQSQPCPLETRLQQQQWLLLAVGAVCSRQRLRQQLHLRQASLGSPHHGPGGRGGGRMCVCMC